MSLPYDKLNEEKDFSSNGKKKFLCHRATSDIFKSGEASYKIHEDQVPKIFKKFMKSQNIQKLKTFISWVESIKDFDVHQIYQKIKKFEFASTSPEVSLPNQDINEVICLAFSHNGKYLAVGNDSALIHLYDFVEKKLVRDIGDEFKDMRPMCLVMTDYCLFSGDATIRKWDINTGIEMETLDGHTGSIRTMVLGKNDSFLVSGSDDGNIIIWNLNLRTNRKILNSHDYAPISDLVLSNNDEELISAGWDKKIKIWRLADLTNLGVLEEHEDVIQGLAISPNGKLLASGGDDLIVRIWDLNAKKQVNTFEGHTEPITALKFSRDGGLLITASHDKTVKIWNIMKNEFKKSFEIHKDKVKCLIVSPDGKTFVSGGSDKKVLINSLEKDYEKHLLEGSKDEVLAIATFPNNSYAISSGKDKIIRVWNIQAAKEIQSLLGHKFNVTTLAVNSTGKHFASGDEGGYIIVWDSETFTMTGNYQMHEGSISFLTFNPFLMDDYLLSCGQDKKIKIFSSSSGSIKSSFDKLENHVSALELHPEGNAIVVAYQDNPEIYQCELNQMNVKMIYRFHTKDIKTLKLKDGSNNLLSASLDGSLCVWKYNTGEMVNKIETNYEIYCLELLNDYFTIITTHSDTKIRLWDLETGERMGITDANFTQAKVMALTADNSALICTGAFNNTLKKVMISKIKTKHILNNHEKGINKVLLTPNQKILAVASSDNTISLWEVKAIQTSMIYKHSLEGHIKAVTGLCFTPDSKFLISSGQDYTMRLWDMESFKQTKINTSLSGEIYDMKIYNIGTRILICCDDFSISIMGLKEFKLMEYSGKVDNCYSIAFESETKCFLAGSLKTIFYVDLAGDKFEFLSKTTDAHEDEITCMAYMSKDEKLITAGKDLAINIWKLKNNNLEWIEQMKYHTKNITSIILNTSQNKLFSASADKKIFVWDLANYKKIAEFEGHTDTVTSLAIKTDEKTLYSGSEDNLIRGWRLNDMRQLKFLGGHSWEIIKIALSWNGNYLASYDIQQRLIIWDLKKNIQKHFIEANQKDNGIDVLFTKDDEKILIARQRSDDSVQVIDVKSGEFLKTIDCIDFFPNRILLTSDEQKLILASSDSKIHFYDFKNESFDEKFLEEHIGSVSVIVLTKDGKTLISGGEDFIVIIWDLLSSSFKKKLKGHKGNINDLVLNQGETVLFSGGADKKVIVWDLLSFTQIKVLDNHPAGITSLNISPDLQRVFVTCGVGKSVHEKKKQIYVYSMKDFQLLPEMDEKLKGVNSLLISRDSKSVIAAGYDKEIRFWEYQTGKLSKVYQGCPNTLQAQTMTSDYELIVLAGEDNMIIVWNLNDQNKMVIFEGHTAAINEVLVTSKRMVISASSDKKIGLWDIHDEKLIAYLHGHPSEVLTIALTKDERQLLSSGKDHTIRIWDLMTHLQIRKLPTDLDVVNAIAICSNGRDFYTGGSEQILKLWNLNQEHEPPVTVMKTDEKILRLKFSPDHKILVILNNDGKIQVCSHKTFTVMSEIKAENTFSMPTFFSSSNNSIMMYYNKLIDCCSGKTIFEFAVPEKLLSFYFNNKDHRFVFLSESFKLLEVNKECFSTYFFNFLNYDSLVTLKGDSDIICNREISTFPYIFSFLHLIAVFDESELFTVEKIKKVYGESTFNLSNFGALDIFKNTPLDILIKKKNTTLIIKYFQILFEYFKKPEHTFYQKTRFLMYDFREDYCMLNLISDLLDIIGDDLSIISGLLDNSLIPFDPSIYNNSLVFTELSEPILIESDTLYIDKDYIRKKMIEFFENEKKDVLNKLTNLTPMEENTSIVKAKIVALPGICNSNLPETDNVYSKLADLEASNVIFTNKVLGTLVNFIWLNQVQFYYRIEFLFFFFFFVIFNVNFAYIRNMRNAYQVKGESLYTTSSILIDSLLFLYAIFCLVNEMRQFLGSSTYFKSIWNYFDMALIPLLLFSSFFDVLLLYISTLSTPNYIGYIQLGYAICMFCFWFRFLSFFRGIKETSSMIRLIFNVISGVKFFVLFMVLFMLTLSMTMYLLHSENSGEVPSLWDTFLAFYESAVGDTSGITDYDLIIPDLAEFFMITSTFLFAIISLNLLVSIIGDKHGENKDNEEKTRVYELLNIIVDLNSSLLSVIVKKFRPPKAGKYLIQLYNEEHEKKAEDKWEEMGSKIEAVVSEMKDIRGIIDEQKTAQQKMMKQYFDDIKNLLEKNRKKDEG